MKLIGLLSCLLLLSCANKENGIFPERKTITESVYASITIQPDSLYKVYSSVQGIMETQFLEEGDAVHQGDAIAQIKNTSSQLQRSNDGLSLALAQEQSYGNTSLLKTIKNDMRSAQLKLSNDSINFYRQQRLWSNNIGSKATYENKKLNYELSKTTLESLLKKYEMTQLELETQMKQASNRYKSSTASSEDFKITSAISGKVYAFYKNTGEIVNTQEPIALIGSDSLFIIEMLVDEKDIVQVTREQSVRVILDAYKDKLFIATVSKIYPKKDERTQTFTVEAVFEKQPSVLYPGLTGEGNIIIAQKKNALVIPKNYLVGKDQVQTVNGLITIVTGMESIDSIEVLSGITAQTELLKKSDD